MLYFQHSVLSVLRSLSVLIALNAHCSQCSVILVLRSLSALGAQCGADLHHAPAAPHGQGPPARHAPPHVRQLGVVHAPHRSHAL